MKYCFIINPASGKSATKEGLEERICEVLGARGADYCVLNTEAPGDIARYIERFSSDNKGEQISFFACGGDGTLCEAVNGIMKIEDRERIRLGIVPVGTGNDFVRNFGARECFLDIEAQLDASEAEIDLMRVNDIYSINMVNIGFDCQVVVKTAKIKKRKWMPSKLAYICGLLLTLIKKPGTVIELAGAEGKCEKKELLLCTFANGSYCGGGFYSNPQASLCDGKVNALFIKNISRLKFLGLVGKYKNGTHLTGEYDALLSSEKSEKYALEFGAPTELSIDGEIIKAERAEIVCVPRALKVLIPRGARA